MRLHILGSSSSGNCYILSNNSEVLLIECGVSFKLIKQALNFDLSKIEGCLITHSHKDHCKAVYDVMKAGITVYTSAGTIEALGIVGNHRVRFVEGGKQLSLGKFTIMPFKVKHDVIDPLCFLIHHNETGNILFLTDACYSAYTFRNLHNIIIEANYAQDIVDQKIGHGTIKFVRDRVLDSHMSIDTCKQLLKANDLSEVNNIVLIHLSDSHSDAVRFKREVEEASGKTVHVARPGLTIDFNRMPFL